MKKFFHFCSNRGLLRSVFIFYMLFLGFSAKSQSSCFEIRFSTENAQMGDTVEVEVSVRGFVDISSYQFAIEWLPADLKFLQHSTSGTPLAYQLFGSASAAQGLFRSLWSEPNAAGVTLADNAVLFKMYFIVLASTPGFYPIKIAPDNYPTTYEAVNLQYVRLPLANTVGGARIDSPSSFAIDDLCITAPPCTGSIGNIDATISGGLPPFDYQWTGPNGFYSQDSALIGIAQGNYALTITDAAGNRVMAVAGFYQSGPSIFASVFSTENATCDLPNGCAVLQVWGGTAPYSFMWSQTGPATKERCDLMAGNIQVSITDVKGCLTTLSFKIGKDSLLHIDLDSLNADCRFDVLGGVNLSVDGTAPHTFQWSNGASTQNLSNIVQGIYSVTATDAIGCSATKSIKVRDYGTFDWTLYLSKVCNTEYQPGVPITTSELKLRSYDFASRAEFPLTLSWSNGTRQNVQTLDDDVFTKDLGAQIGLPNGHYSVSITDAEGCREVREILVDCPGAYKIEDSRPRFHIHDKENSSNSLDSCVEVSAYHNHHIMAVDFGIKWSPYYLDFKEIRITNQAIHDSNFTIYNNSLDFHWESTNPYKLTNHFTLFKICFDRGIGSSYSDVEFTRGTKTPRIVHETDGDLGFIGKNGRVNFVPSQTYGSHFYQINLLQPSCETNGYARIELGEPLSYSYNSYTNITGSHNGRSFTGPDKIMFAEPGEYKVFQSGGYTDQQSSLYAYIPPYTLPATECVWPGDADNNTFVNHFDLLYLGLGMDSQFEPRSESDSIWQGYDAADWLESTSTRNINFKNLDMDGNGFIEPADTAALIRHWGQMINPFTTMQPYQMPYDPDTLDVALKLNISSDTISAGKQVKIPLSLTADGIQGLAFSLSYDSVLVVSEAQFEPSESWLGNPLSDLICVQRDFRKQNRLDIALTRTDGHSASGSGEIGYLTLTFKALPPDSLLRTVLFAAHALAITPAEKLIALGETRQEITLRGQTSSSAQFPILSDKSILLSPNPASDFLLIESNSTAISRVEISSANSSSYEILKLENPLRKVQISLAKMPTGTYFARVFCEQGVAVKKFVVVR